MNSRDIYQKVGKRMAQDGYINNPFAIPTAKEEKGKVIASMNEAILEYSYEKLCNLKMTNQIVMDLGVILDAIDSQLPQEEKEEFFSHYVHCMLNVYNTLEDKVDWSDLYGELEDGRYRLVKRIYDGGAYKYFSTDFYLGDDTEIIN